MTEEEIMPIEVPGIPPQAKHYQFEVGAVNGAKAPFVLEAGQTAWFKITNPSSTWTINGHVCGGAGDGTPIGPSGATEGAIELTRRANWSVIQPDLTKFIMKVGDIVAVPGPGNARLGGHYIHRGPPDGSSSGSILVDAFVA